jgi:hypothetical protein
VRASRQFKPRSIQLNMCLLDRLRLSAPALAYSADMLLIIPLVCLYVCPTEAGLQ